MTAIFSGSRAITDNAAEHERYHEHLNSLLTQLTEHAQRWTGAAERLGGFLRRRRG